MKKFQLDHLLLSLDEYKRFIEKRNGLEDDKIPLIQKVTDYVKVDLDLMDD